MYIAIVADYSPILGLSRDLQMWYKGIPGVHLGPKPKVHNEYRPLGSKPIPWYCNVSTANNFHFKPFINDL